MKKMGGDEDEDEKREKEKNFLKVIVVLFPLDFVAIFSAPDVDDTTCSFPCF